MLLDGVHLPLTTPFYPDGGVYYRKLEHNVRRYSLTPVQGLVLLGGPSESASLTTEEKRAVLKTASETAGSEKVLTATIHEAGVKPALELIEHAADLRFDCALLQAPFPDHEFWWPEQGSSPELLMWFRSIADRSPLPVVLASRVGQRHLSIDVLAGLAEHPNVIGVVEQSMHISRVAELKRATSHVQRTSTTTVTFTAATARMLAPAKAESNGSFIAAESLSGGAAIATAPPVSALKTRTRQTGVQIVWSHAKEATEALLAGAVGIQADVSAAVPQAVFEIWAAWKDGDSSLMHEKQQRVEAAEPFFQHENVAAVKAGAELSGYFGGRPRLPMLALTREKQDKLAALLNGMRS